MATATASSDDESPSKVRRVGICEESVVAHMWAAYTAVDVDAIWETDFKITTDDWYYVETTFPKLVTAKVPYDKDSIFGEGETLHEHLKFVKNGSSPNGTLEFIQTIIERFNAEDINAIQIVINLAYTNKDAIDHLKDPNGKHHRTDAVWAWEACYLLFGTQWRRTTNPYAKKKKARNFNVPIRKKNSNRP